MNQHEYNKRIIRNHMKNKSNHWTIEEKAKVITLIISFILLVSSAYMANGGF